MSSVHKSILDLQNQSKKQEALKDNRKSYVDESPDKEEQNNQEDGSKKKIKKDPSLKQLPNA